MTDDIKKIADWAEIPSEVALYSPLITLEGKSKITIENHLGLRQYSSTEIKIKLKKMNLLINGCALIVEFMNREKICIKGEIIAVKYLF